MKQAYFFYQIWSKLVSVSQDAMMQYLISYTHTTSSTRSAKSALVVLLNKRANSMSHHMTLPAQYLVKFHGNILIIHRRLFVGHMPFTVWLY